MRIVDIRGVVTSEDENGQQYQTSFGVTGYLDSRLPEPDLELVKFAVESAVKQARSYVPDASQS